MKKSVLTKLLVSGIILAACERQDPKTKAGPIAPQKIRIGVLPNERSRNIDLFTSKLGEKTGLTVEVVIPEVYEGLVNDLKNGVTDFAFFPPLVAIQAEREAGAKILLKKVYGKTEFYWSAIVVKATSPYRKVSDLQKKKFAFIDPKSTSGFLYPRAMLKQGGVNVKELTTEFAGTHSKAVEDLLAGKVDGIGIWTDEPKTRKGAWDQVPGVKFKDLRILAVSAPIPSDAFTVRDKLYAEHPSLVLKVMEALISLGDGPDSVLKEVLDVDRMTTATSAHYDTVRSFEKELRDE